MTVDTATRFSDLLSAMRDDDGGLSLEIEDSWCQGRTIFGGLSAALCLEAALRAVPDLPPLRSANVTFVGPAEGVMRGEAQVLRRGKSVCFVEADLIGDKGLATRCVFAFGGARASALDQTWTGAPDVPAPDACEVFIPLGFGPNFVQHFETRLARGARPLEGALAHDHYVWVRHRDVAATGMTALVALADMLPPAVLSMTKQLAPVSSMTWMFNVLTAQPETREGWWLLQSCAEQAGNGYASQDMRIWTRDLDLVVAGRQNVAVFF